MADLEVVVAAIRDKIDFEKAYGEHLELKGRGDEMAAFCVFHENTREPKLYVNVTTGVYHCKNPDCIASKGGDLFTFLMKVRSQSFKEVVAELARAVGVGHLLDEPRTPRIAAAVTDAPPPLITAADLEEYQPPETGLSLDEIRALTAGGVKNGNGAHAVAEPAAAPAAAPLARTDTGPRRSVEKVEMPPLNPIIVERYHAALLASPARLQYLDQRRGLTEETIRQFQIGHNGERYTIPVKDEQGLIRNIRLYAPDAKEAKNKMMSWRKGYGTARLFCLDCVHDTEPMFLFEGEMDCLLARQLGLNAYSTTGGAGTWKESFNAPFAGRRVVLCYDNDKEGRAGARKIAMSMKDIATEIKIVQIPLAEPKGADLTDYIVGHGMTIEDFLVLVEQAPAWHDDGTTVAEDAPEPIEVHLSEASEARYYNQPLLFNAMVSGKTMAPFLVPGEVRVGCPAELRDTFDMCKRCAVSKNGGPVTKTLDFADNEVLQMINVPQATLSRVVKTMAGVPSKCVVSGYDPLKAINVEAVQLIPEIAFSDKETPYVTRAAFYMGHGLQANRSYQMHAITVPEPQKQMATHLITTATPAQSNIDAFSLSKDVVERLKAFRPTAPGVAGLWSHLGVIYADLERVTKIYQRHDIMLAADLVFHSALSFRFQGDLLQRGWTEALIIGDSRTGKSTIVQRLINHYRAGEMTSAENTSVVGLIAALHQIGTTWVLQWGRIPLNDRRLLALDEVSGLPVEGIGKMSSMRSSGIAEIIKVHTERTNARTRMIWISNPRNDRSLSSYSQGTLAVKELIGAPADIARFDLVVTAATADVALSTVNAPRAPETPSVFVSELCHQRVMWAWSRTSDQIVWAEGATEAVLRIATEHGERYRYATEIPLVEPNEQRVKLARLAVATATTFFSSSDDGEEVIVKEEHVQFAAQFLERLYANPTLAFEDYARQQKQLYTISDQSKVEAILARNPRAPEMLMSQNLMTQKDLQEIFGYDDLKETRVAISTLREGSFLSRYGTSGYVKTPAAITMLRKMMTGATPQNDPPPPPTESEGPTW